MNDTDLYGRLVARVPTSEYRVSTLGAVIGAALVFAGVDAQEDVGLIVAGVVAGGLVGLLLAYVAGVVMRRLQRRRMAATLEESDEIDLVAAADARREAARVAVDRAAAEVGHDRGEPYDEDELEAIGEEVARRRDADDHAILDSSAVLESATYEDLYGAAQRIELRGRSKMSKEELAQALVAADPDAAASMVGDGVRR